MAGLQPHCSRKCCFHSRLTGSATGCPPGWLCVEDAWPFPGGPSWLCLQLPKGFPEPSGIDWSQASGSRQNGEIESRAWLCPGSSIQGSTETLAWPLVAWFYKSSFTSSSFFCTILKCMFTQEVQPQGSESLCVLTADITLR